MPSDQVLAMASIAAAWIFCAAVHPAVRRALVNGAHCLGRHTDLWRIPVLFGAVYAAFQFFAAALLHWRLGDWLAWFSPIAWHPAPELTLLLYAGLTPGAERAASAFTIFTATFPLSAWFALLLLFNYQDLLSEMTKALHRRLGNAGGLAVTTLILIAACCAAAKPAVYLMLPEISDGTIFFVAVAATFFSVIFELLLGIFFLTYLMLMTYAWIRGLSFHRFKLFHVAMRRTGFVLKWSLPLAFLTALFIMAPLYLGIFLAPEEELHEGCVWFSNWIGRPLITAVALIGSPMQATLVFHNESLRKALKDSGQFLRMYWLSISLFFCAAYLAFFLLGVACDYLAIRLGIESPAALAVLLPASIVEAILAGWLIASWVCLYKSLTAGRKEILF